MQITTHESDDYSLLDLHELVLVEIGPVVDRIIATLFPGLHGKVHHLVAVSPLFDTRLIGIIVPVFGGFRRLNATLDLFIACFNVKVQEDGVQDELHVFVLHERLHDVIVRRALAALLCRGVFGPMKWS